MKLLIGLPLIPLAGCLGYGLISTESKPLQDQLIPNGTATQRGCRDGRLGGYSPERVMPEWVSVESSDAPKTVEGVISSSHISTNEFPLSHAAHDHCSFLQPDPGYKGVMSDANDVEDGVRIIEVEWDSKFNPPQFWSSVGDRAWMMGRWIFDCGHPPYHSEIHPPVATAYTRPAPFVFRGDTTPANSVKTFLFVNGQGGYYNRSISGSAFDFDIQVPAPPRGRRVAEDALFGRRELKAQIVSLPFGGPTPVLTPKPAENKVHVHYAMNGATPTGSGGFGAIIAAGWHVSGAIPATHLVRVTLNSVKVNTDHDPIGSGSGEWNLWINVNGDWAKVSGMSDVDDGDTVKINRTVYAMVRDDIPLTITTTGYEDDTDSSYHIVHNVSASDAVSALHALNGNDNIGSFLRTYGKAEGFGVGTHTNELSKRNGDSDTDKDFSLNYTVSLVRTYSGGVPAHPVIR